MTALFALCAAARSYAVDGVVVAVDPGARTMLVAHRPIGKYMGAMMMPFRVEEARELAGLHPGARVTFDLVVGRGASVARRVKVVGEGDAPVVKGGIAIGDALPPF